MDCEFWVDGKLHKVSLEIRGDGITAVVDGNLFELDISRPSPNSISLLVGGKTHLAHIARDGNRIHIAIGASRFVLEEPQRDNALGALKEKAAGQVEGTIKAPMPGQVIKVNVTQGAAVQPGDSLVVVEAMKMEHEMRATFPAVVEKIHVQSGQQVDAFQPLVDLKPAETSA